MKKILFAGLVVFSMQACQQTATNETHTDTTHRSDAAHNDSNTPGRTNTMHDAMMESMHAAKLTGEVDHDFAALMIPHHQGAVDMSEDYLTQGHNETIKSMASKIIATQKKEIEELKSLMANLSSTKAGDGHSNHAENEMMQAMNKMMEEMNAVRLIGNPDKDFVAMMIPHHQSAVDMAKTQLSKGKNAAMKRFAEKVVTDQQKEIVQFQQWLMENN